MKKSFIIICLISLFYSPLISQTTIPDWCDKGFRETNYPMNLFLTGYMEGGVIGNESIEEAMERLKKMAQSELIENVIVQIQSYTESVVKDVTRQNNSNVVQYYEASVKTESNMELTGLVSEAYYNESSQTIQAFAYANRSELIGYYKATLAFCNQQITQIIEGSDQLFNMGEKVKAKNELEQAIPLFAKIDYSYGLLIALKGSIDTLQYTNTMKLRNSVIQKLAQWEKGILVNIQSQEDIFGTETEILANALKRDLKNCSYTEDESAADWKVIIQAKARDYKANSGLYFSYADVVVSLTKVKTGQLVYQEEFSQKGGGPDYQKAARKAMEEAGNVLSGKIIAEMNK